MKSCVGSCESWHRIGGIRSGDLAAGLPRRGQAYTRHGGLGSRSGKFLASRTFQQERPEQVPGSALASSSPHRTPSLT
jgi:hypothetical protein